MSGGSSGGQLTVTEGSGRSPIHLVPIGGPAEDPSPTKRRRGPGARDAWAVVVLLLVLVGVTGVIRPWNWVGGAAPRKPMVVASLPVWNLAGGSAAIAAHASVIDSASPSMFEVGPAGEVLAAPQPPGVSVSGALATLRASHVPVVPIITNTRNGQWDTPLVQQVLHDPVLVQRHIAAIETRVRHQGFAGVDIDYENLVAADRAAFTDFITRLAERLHAIHKTVTVDVFAKADDAGYDARNQAQDYAALGRAADQLRVMAYDWHWQTSAAGPIAPLDWVRGVLAYAVSQVPAHKIVLGIPTYGYGWVGDNGRLVSWLQAFGLSKQLGVPVHWDTTAQSPWIAYVDAGGVSHTMWFENTYSIKAKLDLAHSFGVGGVYLWLVGDEDSGVWPVVADYGRGSTMRNGASK